MAHEIGHFLGLWHTTELSPTTTGTEDPITDTPVCASGTAIQSCPDYRNLMFPNFPTSSLVLSAGQTKVLRKSPWLYRLDYPDACGAGIDAIDVESGFASSQIDGTSAMQGSCGGATGGERVHLLRIDKTRATLSIKVTSSGFAPALYVLRGSCGASAKELDCAAAGVGEAATLALSDVEPGAYYIVVDAVSGSGRYRLELGQ